jgi:serine/threonine protein kinase
VTRAEDGLQLIAKVIHVPDSKTRSYAQSEIRCLSMCKHFAIVRHYDHAVSEDGQHMLLVMEFADAGDLNGVLHKRGQERSYFKEHEVAFLFLQVLLALDYVHRHNMMHRDIKSANVFVMRIGIAKLGDFGFSKQAGDTAVQTVCGTPYYVAPEIWRSEPYGRRADVWSLGVLIYEIAALRRPFAGTSMVTLMHSVLTGQYPPLPDMYSGELKELVAAMLTMDPANRPSTRQLLMRPYMARVLADFERTISENPSLSAEQKAEILRETAECRKLNEEAVTAPPGVEATGNYAGVVYKKSERSGWRQRWLALEKNELVICAVGDKAGEQKRLDVRTKVIDVLPGPPQDYDGRENIFVIELHDSSRVVFQAPNSQDRTQWIEHIRAAIGSN